VDVCGKENEIENESIAKSAFKLKPILYHIYDEVDRVQIIDSKWRFTTKTKKDLFSVQIKMSY
jgi:hypothetical protein